MNVTQVTTIFHTRTPEGADKSFHNAFRPDDTLEENTLAPVKKLVLHINKFERVEVILDSRPIEDIDSEAERQEDATRPTTD